MLADAPLAHVPDSSTPFMQTSFAEVSVVLPCLNEAETLLFCLNEIKQISSQHRLSVEVIVADNGSNDNSVQLAEHWGARVVLVARRGYGNAIMGGIQAARGQYIIMADADGSYNFNDLPRVLAHLRLGNELVIGNRFRGGIEYRAMPMLNRYLGNPVLSAIGRVLFNVPLGDFHCGLRGFDRRAALRWQLSEPGMEFASEMIVKAALHDARIAEVPVSLRRDGRSRPPHLRPWRDGWRHLSLLCRYYLQSPVS